MFFLSGAKLRLAGVAFIAVGCVFGQQTKKQAAPPKQTKTAATTTEPKFKAIWEPVNVKEDIALTSVYFATPEEGWVAGGRTGMQGGVILHTADAGANWQLQLGDTQ